MSSIRNVSAQWFQPWSEVVKVLPWAKFTEMMVCVPLFFCFELFGWRHKGFIEWWARWAVSRFSLVHIWVIGWPKTESLGFGFFVWVVMILFRSGGWGLRRVGMTRSWFSSMWSAAIERAAKKLVASVVTTAQVCAKIAELVEVKPEQATWALGIDFWATFRTANRTAYWSCGFLRNSIQDEYGHICLHVESKIAREQFGIVFAQAYQRWSLMKLHVSNFLLTSHVVIIQILFAWCRVLMILGEIRSVMIFGQVFMLAILPSAHDDCRCWVDNGSRRCIGARGACRSYVEMAAHLTNCLMNRTW